VSGGFVPCLEGVEHTGSRTDVLFLKDAAVLFSILYVMLRGIGGDGTEPARAEYVGGGQT
jgi:hypothetical protein